MLQLDVAGRAFAARGYAAATSKEICERAGGNLAAVNNHFGGKQGLYRSVLAKAWELRPGHKRGTCIGTRNCSGVTARRFSTTTTARIVWK